VKYTPGPLVWIEGVGRRTKHATQSGISLSASGRRDLPVESNRLHPIWQWCLRPPVHSPVANDWVCEARRSDLGNGEDRAFLGLRARYHSRDGARLRARVRSHLFPVSLFSPAPRREHRPRSASLSPTYPHATLNTSS
jgi:hypothetical protein